MKNNQTIIGEEFLDQYNVGDIVRYCGDTFQDCIELRVGIILDIINLSLWNEIYLHAKVYVMGHDKEELVMLGNLTILYKVSD
tara:strand:- start:839 stop:1087 length:249 start_codon:yes stop_codon:yes gene_type:complete